MSIRRLSMILGDVELKRVVCGEKWASELSKACETVNRDCNGIALADIYDRADQATKDALESVLVMSEEDLHCLIDEVYRIKLGGTLGGVDPKEMYVLAVTSSFGTVVVIINFIVIALYIATANKVEPLPVSYVIGTLSGLIDAYLSMP